MPTAKKRSTAKRKNPRRWVAKVKTESTFPPDGLFSKKRSNYRPNTCVEEGFAEGSCLWNANADLLHQSRRARVDRGTPCGVGESQETPLEDGEAGERRKEGGLRQKWWGDQLSATRVPHRQGCHVYICRLSSFVIPATPASDQFLCGMREVA